MSLSLMMKRNIQRMLFVCFSLSLEIEKRLRLSMDRQRDAVHQQQGQLLKPESVILIQWLYYS